jgi:hypothetical protein
MTILKELCVAAGQYELNGEPKTRWTRIGHLHETQDKTRQYITLDPAYNLAAFPKKDGDDRLYVNLFDPKPKDGAKPARQQPQKSAPADFDAEENIPF